MTEELSWSRLQGGKIIPLSVFSFAWSLLVVSCCASHSTVWFCIHLCFLKWFKDLQASELQHSRVRDQDEGCFLSPPPGSSDRSSYSSVLETIHFCEHKTEVEWCSGVLQEELCRSNDHWNSRRRQQLPEYSKAFLFYRLLVWSQQEQRDSGLHSVVWWKLSVFQTLGLWSAIHYHQL